MKFEREVELIIIITLMISSEITFLIPKKGLKPEPCGTPRNKSDIMEMVELLPKR